MYLKANILFSRCFFLLSLLLPVIVIFFFFVLYFYHYLTLYSWDISAYWAMRIGTHVKILPLFKSSHIACLPFALPFSLLCRVFSLLCRVFSLLCRVFSLLDAPRPLPTSLFFETFLRILAFTLALSNWNTYWCECYVFIREIVYLRGRYENLEFLNRNTCKNEPLYHYRPLTAMCRPQIDFGE